MNTEYGFWSHPAKDPVLSLPCNFDQVTLLLFNSEFLSLKNGNNNSAITFN